MKLIVTGGTGFIGSHFINHALAQKHTVLAIRRNQASTPRVPIGGDHKWITKPMIDIETSELLDCDVLVHLAAHGVSSLNAPIEECLKANVSDPLVLFRKAAAAGIKRFVIAGSCFEYGRSAERYQQLSPDAPLEPTNSYATSKAAASLAFVSFAEQADVQLSIHRIFHVFGEGELETRLWPSLRRAAVAGRDLDLTAGEQVRDFVPVESVAARLLDACGNSLPPNDTGRIYNLGTGKPQTIREFAEHWWHLWKATGKLRFGALPYRPNEVMRYVGSST